MGAKIDCWDIDVDLIVRCLVARTVANERRPMEVGGGLVIFQIFIYTMAPVVCVNYRLSKFIVERR